MKKLQFVFLFLIGIQLSYAQDFTISGKLMDGAQNFPLESATIYAEKVSDSTLITYTISDQNGDFQLKGFSQQNSVRINISYTGYAPYSELVTLTSRDVALGTLKLQTQSESLKTVTITGSRAPITIKKDTLEFNVASFKTKKGANVEDLLKELPGVEVDDEGNITVNGKSVNKVLVNGKAFFGDDPTIATRNLTKDIIEKIQVTDTKTKSEAFTGEKGDQENKTINITIDEEKNKGFFGRVAAGGGTDDRFEYAGIINYFDNDLRLSALGGGNNLNSPGFSFGELQKMYGGARSISVSDNGINFGGRNFGGGQGITNSRTGGANYADEFGKDSEISADYFYSAANSFNEERISRENILPDNRFFSEKRSESISNSDNHGVNTRFETKIDSTFLINIRPQFNYSIGESRLNNEEETRNVDQELTNTSRVDNSSKRDRISFENDLLVTKKYGTKGGYVRLSIRNNINETNVEDFNASTTQIFGEDPQTIIRDQFTDSEQGTTGYNIGIDWRIPLIEKKLFLGLEHSYENEDREDRQSVFDFNTTTQDYTDFNLQQSTDFNNRNERQRPEVSMNYNGEKLYARVGGGYVIRTLESEDALRDFTFSNDFNAFELSSYFGYTFNDKMRISTGYSINNNAPSVSQLSPFVDVSDPLNIQQGNPNLKPTNDHRVYFNFNNYDFQSRSGIFSYVSVNTSNDAVTARTTVDENFVRTTTFTNVDGVYNLYGNVNYNKTKKLDTIRSLRYRAGMNVNANRNVNFNNDTQYASRTITYRPNIGVDFIWKDLFEIKPSYSLSLSQNTFNIDLFEDRDYMRHEFTLRTTTTWPENLEWNNDIDFINNPDVAQGFQQNAVFWNSTLAYSFIKDKAIATLKVYDLLGQNTNARRSSTAAYIQDVQSTVLQQYFLLSFSYKFNTLGKKGESRDGGFFFD